MSNLEEEHKWVVEMLKINRRQSFTSGFTYSRDKWEEADGIIVVGREYTTTVTESIIRRKETDINNTRICQQCKKTQDIENFAYNRAAFNDYPDIDNFCQICWINC